MKPIRLFVLSAAAALLSTASAAPASTAFAASQEAAESEACACTCAACLAKHGPKAAPAAAVPDSAASVEDPLDAIIAEVQRDVLPALGPDVSAEVAKVLAMELSEIETLLEDVTSGEEVRVELRAPAAAASEGERGYLGISLGSSPAGATVGTVTPGSPADGAGLKPGDVIVTAEEFPIDSAEDLIAALIEMKVGETASLEIERGDKTLSMDVVLAPRMAQPVQVLALEVPAPAPTPGRALELVEEVEELEEVEVQLPTAVGVLREIGYVGDDVEVTVEVEVEVETDEPSARKKAAKEKAAKKKAARQKAAKKKGAKQKAAKQKAAKKKADKERAAKKKARERAEAPYGYIEIETRRERRPAGPSDLAERIEKLEAQVARLQRALRKMQAELDRRNPR